MSFNPEKCTLCGDCLTRCQYMEYDQEQAVQEVQKLIAGVDSPVLSECTTCLACDEYCPTGAGPFERIAELQEQYGSRGFTEGALAMLRKQYETYDSDRVVEVKGPLMSQCAFLRTHAAQFAGQLFGGLTLVGGRNFFCNLIYNHTGQISIARERAETIVANLAKFGTDEVSFFHDECYAFFAKYLPAWGIDVPFRPVHIYEHLLKYVQAHPGAVKPLNLKVAYQRSCSTRLTPEKDKFLDELLQVIGVERVERTYDGGNALCCQAPVIQAAGAADRKKVPREITTKRKKEGRGRQRANIEDAVSAGAYAMVFICPMCIETLKGLCKKSRLHPIFITDLVRMALGEIPVPDSFD